MHHTLTTVVEASSVPPLDGHEFAKLMAPFGPFAEKKRIAVAVSGGPDSMALAWLTGTWAGPDNIIAFIIDHGLRPNSATEAVETKKRLKTIGIASEILSWEHAPIVSKLHVTARRARYRLLIDACRAHGIADLLFAHQREDQAETILMRLAKGGGIDGLAGMPAMSMKEGVRLLRPLLTIAKERLVATCAAAGLSFLRDPSNQSDRFARGRLRRVMPLLAEEGLTVDTLLLLGARAAEVRAALDYYVRIFMQSSVKQDRFGVTHLQLESLRHLPQAVAMRTLAACLSTVHAGNYGAEEESLKDLLSDLLGSKPMPPRTLQGCLIAKTETEASIMREFAGVTDSSIICAGENVVWDGRWEVTLPLSTDNSSYTVQPLGNPSHEILDGLAPHLRHDLPQGRARASLPSLWKDGVLTLIPHFDNEFGEKLNSASARILRKNAMQ